MLVWKKCLLIVILTLVEWNFAFAKSAFTSQFIISGPSPHAVAAAQRVYKQGGNVVDAAVAAALALAVVTPHLAALGGGGFAMVHIDGGATKGAAPTTQALDFRETAPAGMTMKSFSGKPASASVTGGLAIGVPGIPAGLHALHKKYGRRPWRELFAVAIELAEKGFPVGGEWVQVTAQESVRFNPAARAVFLKNDQLLIPG